MENPVIQSSQVDSDTEALAKARRQGRKCIAERFRTEYFYGRCKDEKTCVWPGGCESWLDESSGITWAGVYGNDTICVVTKAGDLDLSRVHDILIYRTKEDVFRMFMRTVISEMEDLAALGDPVDLDDLNGLNFAYHVDYDDLDDLDDDCSPLRLCSSCRHLKTLVDHKVPLSKLCEMFGKSMKPFGVVSVVPLTDKVHKMENNMVMGWLINILEPPIARSHIFIPASRAIWISVRDMYSDLKNN